jgi:hypothetical protein
MRRSSGAAELAAPSGAVFGESLSVAILRGRES